MFDCAFSSGSPLAYVPLRAVSAALERRDYRVASGGREACDFAGYLSPGGALQLAITGHPRAGAWTDDARQARRSLVLGQFVVEEADDVGGGAAGFAHVGHGDGPDVEEARAPL